MTLSDTQSSILQQAPQHPDGLVVPPAYLPLRPGASIARALLNAGLVARSNQRTAAMSLPICRLSTRDVQRWRAKLSDRMRRHTMLHTQ